MAAALAHALAKFFALIGGHLLPALVHASSPMHRTPWPAAETAEQDPAQHQQAERLPEGDGSQSEQSGHQPIPQAHGHQAENSGGKQGEECKPQTSSHPISFHVVFLMLS